MFERNMFCLPRSNINNFNVFDVCYMFENPGMLI